jgi:excisionase family DNA binding protein
MMDTIPQACARLKVSRSALYAQMRLGQLRAVKVGRRTLITRAEQQRWLSELPSAYPAAPRSQ